MARIKILKHNKAGNTSSYFITGSRYFQLQIELCSLVLSQMLSFLMSQSHCDVSHITSNTFKSHVDTTPSTVKLHVSIDHLIKLINDHSTDHLVKFANVLINSNQIVLINSDQIVLIISDQIRSNWSSEEEILVAANIFQLLPELWHDVRRLEQNWQVPGNKSFLILDLWFVICSSSWPLVGPGPKMLRVYNCETI